MYRRRFTLSRAALFQAVLLIASALNVLEAQPKVTVAPLDASLVPALTATLPPDPAFRASIESLLTPAVFAIFKPVLPYSMVVRNQSSIPVLAVVVYVDIVDAEGHRSSEMQATGNIPPADKNDFLLGPGKDMIFTADRRYGGEAIRVIREGIRQPDARLEQLAQQSLGGYISAASVTFVLDSIVLADGTFVGPDKPHVFGGLVSRLATEAKIARAVLAFQGHKPDDLAQYLATVAAELEPHHADGSVTQAQLARQYLLVFRRSGAKPVFDLAAKDLERATAFSIHR